MELKEKGAIPPITKRGIRISIVDDDKDFRQTVRQMIARRGEWVVDSDFGDGRSALRAFAKQPPDLILLDIILPGMSGIEIAKKVRTKLFHLPIIMMTGCVGTVDLQSSLEAGATGYLVKPFSVADLYSAIVDAIQGRIIMSGTMRDALISIVPQRKNSEGNRPRLTPRERAIVKLILKGYKDAAIASELGVSKNTVATHLRRLYSKWHVHTRSAAIAVAYSIV